MITEIYIQAYYEPFAHRPGLMILCEATAERIELEPGLGPQGDVRATGVHFHHDGKAYFVRAAREIIVSAGEYLRWSRTYDVLTFRHYTGAFISPQILELSGLL